MNERLYQATVTHARPGPPAYRFHYRVFSFLLDLDGLAQLDRRLKWFSYNRRNLVSFYDADHGPRDGTPCRQWLDSLLRDAEVDLAGGSIRVLCFPRVLGYVFNPLSVWYAYHADGSLRAVVCEVSNTFGEFHWYLLKNDDGRPLDPTDPPSKQKAFHVSPFFSVEGEYRFRFRMPDERVGVEIDYLIDGLPVLYATLHGRAQALTDRAILLRLLGMPLMTLKVTAMIYWQALKLWLRGASFHPKPATPPHTRSSSS